MIMLTKKIDGVKIGVNPDHLITADPFKDDGTYIVVVGEGSYLVTETPKEIEVAISNHFIRYTTG